MTAIDLTPEGAEFNIEDTNKYLADDADEDLDDGVEEDFCDEDLDDDWDFDEDEDEEAVHLNLPKD